MQGYLKPNLNSYKGRIDSKTEYKSFRWHQIIKPLDLSNDVIGAPLNSLSFVIIGYQIDKGISLNNGRSGAKEGPDAIRSFLSNKPCSFSKDVRIYDGGNVIYQDSVENAQKLLSNLVSKAINSNYFPIVLGGGHDVALGTMQGLFKIINDFAIINFDAHFDLRDYHQSTSGTMFRQIYQQFKSLNIDFKHLTIGIQKSANTVSLFEYANEINSKYILAGEVNSEFLKINEYKIDSFTKQTNNLYVSVCCDVFASPFACGVSSPQPMGILPEDFLIMLKQLLDTKKVRAFDIAEISPSLDNSNATASLGALIIYTLISHLSLIYNHNII